LNRTDFGRRIRVHFTRADHKIALWFNERLHYSSFDQKDDLDFQLSEELLAPVQIIVGDASVAVSNLRISRDVYYTQQPNQTDFLATDAGRDLMGDVSQFKRFRDARQRTREFTVPPASYFALGDNSPRSHDSRSWKSGPYIPSRLILGRVLTGVRLWR
jgi:hypothetical protein